ncbi:hypothetical protein YC2023_060101 [Brassica napus]
MRNLEKEFSLSSTDLFHFPAGDSPEVMRIPEVPTVNETKLASTGFDEIEYLDPKIVCEDNQMVSNYLATPCSVFDEFVSSETGFVNQESTVRSNLTVNIERLEQHAVQQDIDDMYTKSLQQFTKSLAKMKLLLDMVSPTQSENSFPSRHQRAFF